MLLPFQGNTVRSCQHRTPLLISSQVCVGYMYNVYANTVCLEHVILSPPSLPPSCSIPKYTVSWKPHLRLLIGMGRAPSYALRFLTPAYEFLSRASCNKPQGLAERCKIFISGPNKVFIGFREHSSLQPRLRTSLFSSPSQFGSLPASLGCSQLCGKCEDSDSDISSEGDIGGSHGCLTFATFL